jgi:hypothetical protein
MTSTSFAPNPHDVCCNLSNRFGAHRTSFEGLDEGVIPIERSITIKSYSIRRKQVPEIELGSYTKYQVEDFTGCIPLFLDKCVVNGRIDLNVKFFAEIASQAMAFERELLVWYNSFYLHNFANVFRHCYEYVKACLFGLPVCPSAKDISRLVDHRYFYDEYDPARHSFMGHYTCGICRNSVSTMLLSSKMLFDDKDLLHLQPDGVTNPCVAGFVIEHVVLSSIALKPTVSV